MSKKFNINPPTWPREYSFKEFASSILAFNASSFAKILADLDDIIYNYGFLLTSSESMIC